MDPSTWKRVQELFMEAVDLSEADRAAYLEEAEPDEGIRAWVMELLSADTDPAPVLDSPAEVLLGSESLSDSREVEDGPAVPKIIGPYRLHERLGVGGMGVVYAASHDAFDRRVALKVIRPGARTDEIVARFAGERQILARLEHPNIARLLDGGVADDGSPWFSMDLVVGRPIDRYCDEEGLDVPERLALFAQVCDAVQYANANLVVHRDLKPTNILVTPDGTPKLLDFGIAKVLKETADAAELEMTRTGVRPMSPLYAAPEQVRHEPVTTATDVYALGVVLYRLLTGVAPYGDTPTPLELEQAILTSLPPAPSTAMPAQGGSRDVDNITGMALRKEPERRYASAGALAEDIRRYLDGHPVVASGDDLPYRIRKFVRRNRGLVSALAAAVVLLTGTVITYTVQLRQERDRAEAEGARAQAVADFLKGIFEVSSPSESLGREVTAREILQTGSEQLQTDLADQPDLLAEMMATVGDVYVSLGLNTEAEPHLQQALDLRRSLHPGDHEDVAESLRGLATLYRRSGGMSQADSVQRLALGMSRRVFGDIHSTTADNVELLGSIRQEFNDAVGADSLFGEALVIRRTLFSGDSPAIASSLRSYGAGKYIAGDYTAADTLFRAAAEMYTRVHGVPHPKVARTNQDVAITRLMLGHRDEAEALLRDVVAMLREVYGPAHPDVGEGLHSLGSALQFQGRYEEAVETFQEAISLFETVHGPDHQDIAGVLSPMGRSLRLLGRPEEAETAIRRCIAIRIGIFGPEDPGLIQPYSILGNSLADQGRLEEAEETVLTELELKRSIYGEESNAVITFQNLAGYREDLGDADGALLYHQQALDESRRIWPDTPTEHTQALFPMAGYLGRAGRLDEAAEVYGQALAIRLEAFPEGAWQIANAQSLLADVYIGLARFDEAESLLLAAHEAFSENDDPGDASIIAIRGPEAVERLIRLYDSWGRPEEADRWRGEGSDPITPAP